jgi:hypothetical protein
MSMALSMHSKPAEQTCSSVNISRNDNRSVHLHQLQLLYPYRRRSCDEDFSVLCNCIQEEECSRVYTHITPQSSFCYLRVDDFSPRGYRHVREEDLVDAPRDAITVPMETYRYHHGLSPYECNFRSCNILWEVVNFVE